MFRHRLFAATLLFLSFANLAFAATPEPGKYKLMVARGLDTELTVCIVTLEQSGNGWSAKMLSRNTALGKVAVGDAAIVGDFLRINMNISDEEVVFEGATRGKSVVGSCGNDRRMVVATLSPTDEDVVVRERMTSPRDLPPLLKEIVKLNTERLALEKLLGNAAISSDRDRVASQLELLRKRIAEQRPKVFARLLTEDGEHPIACEAGVGLLQDCGSDEQALQQLQAWTDTTLKCAARLGPRFRRHVLFSTLDLLSQNPKALEIAANLAERIDQEFLNSESPTVQSRVLSCWLMTLQKPEQATRRDEISDRLAKVEARLDDEYRAHLPKINATKFEKRKDKANCVAFFELFIGAEGQSGIGAGLAFDKLFDIYQPTEAVAIQYHLHAPEPDALANEVSQKRFNYYSEKYPRDTDVVPASFVNGRPCGCGGARIHEVRDKLKEYCNSVSPLVNAETPVKLSAKAKRTGDQVEVEVKAEGIPADSRERKMFLRMALVESSVRYPAGNGLRFHRQVVRAMPGGLRGAELTVDSLVKKEIFKISDIRNSLIKELDKLAANGTPLSGPYRPVELKDLKLVAWVQSDKDRAVWQAVQVDVNAALP